jgi:hypothetical protein
MGLRLFVFHLQKGKNMPQKGTAWQMLVVEIEPSYKKVF